MTAKTDDELRAELEQLLEQARRLVENAEDALERAKGTRAEAILAARRFGIPQRRVGELAGVSGPRVHQIEQAAG